MADTLPMPDVLYGVENLPPAERPGAAPQADPVPPADFAIPTRDGGPLPGGKAFAPDDSEPVRTGRRGRGRPPVNVGDPAKTVSVRGIPKKMLSIARNAFTGDVTQVDAFVAYLVCNCPEFAADNDLRTIALTDRQRALVRAWDKSPQADMVSRMQAVTKKLDQANRRIAVMTGILGLLLYEYSGNDGSGTKLTASRVNEADFMSYDKAGFDRFQSALVSTFLRYAASTAARDGEFFAGTSKDQGGMKDRNEEE